MLPVLDGGIVHSCTLEEWSIGKLSEIAKRKGVKVPPLLSVSKTPALIARVNYNRWIVDCPDCGGAEFVWSDKLLMLCANCWNGAVNHQWRRVTMPINSAAIEAVLKARPIPANRNWEPHETIKDLEAENAKKGLPKKWQVLPNERG
jgi:hypothetical protein